jgi:tetratricopeptide (TPR) repeat protein
VQKCRRERKFHIRLIIIIVVVLLALTGVASLTIVPRAAHAGPQVQQPTPAASEECNALLQQGVDLYYRSRYQEALTKFKDALTCYQEAKDREREGTTLDYIGAVHYSLGQYQEALKYFQQALDVHREVGGRAGEGAALNNIGVVYRGLGQYQRHWSTTSRRWTSCARSGIGLARAPPSTI